MEENAKNIVTKGSGRECPLCRTGWGREGLALALTLLNAGPFLLLAALIALPAPAAIAADEPVLKPDVPKFDATDSPDRSTLKGTIEHRLSVPPPAPRKPKRLNAATNANNNQNNNKPPDFQLSGAQRAQRDRERVLKARAQEQALNARQPFTIEQSVGIIGVKFHKLPDGPAVINTVFAGTPAAKAGMHVDDQIVAVDGVPTRNLNKDQCYDLIVGSPDTPVTLSVLRRQNFDVKQMVRMDFNDIPDPLVRRDYLNSL